MKTELHDDTAAYPAAEIAYKSDPMMACIKSEIHPHSRPSQEAKVVMTEEDPQGDGREPTLEEQNTLRRVADTIPASAWLVVVVEFCERFTYYGLSGPFQNYIQYPYTAERGADHPGAIGKGQQTATALNYFFQCMTGSQKRRFIMILCTFAGWLLDSRLTTFCLAPFSH